MELMFIIFILLLQKNVEIRETLHEIYSADVIGRPTRNADGSMRFRVGPEHDRVLRFKRAVAEHNRRLLAQRATQINKEMNDRMASIQTSYSQRQFLTDYYKKKSVMIDLKKQPHVLKALNNFNFLTPAMMPLRPMKSKRSIDSNRSPRGNIGDARAPPWDAAEAFAAADGHGATAAPEPAAASHMRIICEVKQSVAPKHPNEELEVEVFRLIEPLVPLDAALAYDTPQNETHLPRCKGQVGLIVEYYSLKFDARVNSEFLCMDTLNLIAEEHCLDLSRKLRRVKHLGVKLHPDGIDFLDPSASVEGQSLDVFEPLQLALDPAGEELLCSFLLDFYLKSKLRPLL
jgi:hypothetical protein